MPTTLAETIRIADSYALGDPTLPSQNEIPTTYEAHQGAGTSGGQGRQDFRHKRNHERPAYRYNQVAAVEPDKPDAGNAQHQKHDNQPWAQRKPWDKNGGNARKKAMGRKEAVAR